MDQTVVGLPAASTATVGDEVVVAGDGSDGAMTIQQIADLVETIPYEIVTGLSARVPRVYVTGGRAVAVEDLQGLHSIEG